MQKPTFVIQEHIFSIVAVLAPLVAGLGSSSTEFSLIYSSFYEKYSIKILYISCFQIL